MTEVNLFVPGRIGLIGEISDLVSPYLSKNKELIFGHAITLNSDRGIYSKAKKSDRFIYKSEKRNFECNIEIDELKKEAESNSFYSYMCGTILYILKNYDNVFGIDIEIEKMDLPINKGLASSAAICISIAKAYNELYELNLSDDDIKSIAYNGEHLAGSKCGKLDQESIFNESISHIIFEENKVHSEPINIKENVYGLVVDLNAEKDTRVIMNCFNNILPNKRNKENEKIHDIVGINNKKLVEMAINGLENGDLKKLGEALNLSQKLMDDASDICVEYKAPILHEIISNETVKKLTYGAKSSGSGGDGTVVLICKNENSQKELKKYIKEEYNMDSIEFCIEKSKKDVVIIGAGPAGLSTAYHLLKNSNDYNVTILEKDNQVGGISKTINFNGYRVDTGIHRFFTKNDEVQKMWEDILPIQAKPAYDDILLNKQKDFPKNGPDPEKENNCMLIKDRVTRIYYGRKFYDYPVTFNFDTIKNMGFFTLIKAGFSYLKACIIKREENSLEDFFINRFGKVLYKMFFESYTEKVWGIAPDKISADWGAQRVKGVSIKVVLQDMFKKFIGKKNNNNSETSLIEKFIYPKLGAGQIYEEMANIINKMGGTILLNSEVKQICVQNNEISKVIYEGNNKANEIKTDILISSMPIKDLIYEMQADIPEEIYNIAVNLPYREFGSVALLVDKLNLKNTTNIKTLNNIVPDSWIYIQEPDVKMGRLQIFNNWSPYLFKEKEEIKDKVLLSLEYFFSEGDGYWEMKDEDFINFAIAEAEKIGLIDKNSVRESILIKIPKAYPAYFGTYKDINKVIEFLNMYNNLYCIGRNGQHKYNNMDHSILTGIEVAKVIINNSKNKETIWNVNTEKEYHEIKNN